MDDSNIVCYFARHGTTTLNASGCFRGNANPPLDQQGIADAHKLAKLFENIEVGAIVCSDRIRATQTADIVAARKQMPVHKTESLRALNVGDFSGQPRNKENTDKLEAYIQSPDTQIPGGESLNEFKTRIKPCFEEAVDLAEEMGNPVLLVVHSSVIHELGSVLYGDHKHILVEPGGVVALYVRDGKLGAEPIHRPVVPQPTDRSDTVS